jgi:predicted glycosyltransferase
MRIWIDLSNSPHPLLFGPVAHRLEGAGHSVLITARDNAQTIELARERWDGLTVIGGKSPKGRRAKAHAIYQRVVDLRRWAATAQPDVALSHNSYAQIVAARTLRIPAVTAMDFEHQPANHLAFRLARTVLLPQALEQLGLHRQGATPAKTCFYPGLKEEVYLGDFEPDRSLRERLAIASDRKLVVARPAPDQAVYHSFENPLFVDCIRAVLRDPQATVVVLPRRPEQGEAIAALGLERCIVAERALDSRSLMSQAELMIGAGGTMTREAALMGVPTVSLFAGHRPAVDTWLERHGFMSIITDVDRLPTLQTRPDGDRLEALRRRGDILVGHFCDAVEATRG